MRYNWKILKITLLKLRIKNLLDFKINYKKLDRMSGHMQLISEINFNFIGKLSLNNEIVYNDLIL